MYTFEWIIGLLLGAVLLSALARRTNVPYPIFLALGGMALAFVPGIPTWTMEPELALALFVAPVLLDAAFDTLVRDLRENWLPVTTLVIVAVGLTTLAVALAARWMVPDMPWAVAIALGAIVAPPDAAAATAILRQINLPHRLMKILEGESLLNDASALLIYRIAVTVAMAGHVSASDLVPTIALGLVGSVIAGFAFAKANALVTMRIRDTASSIIMQFASTFTVWIVAERLGLSGILTIVVYAITVARTAPATIPARLRVPSYAVWDTMVFVLNVLAFMVIGMQLRPILANLDAGIRLEYALVATVILAVVILTRIGWVMAYNLALRMKIARFGTRTRRPLAAPSAQGGLVIAWCGMRGIVTLAAAFALPDNFPYRGLILLTAFAVVLGSLLIQGLTLRPLIASLRFADDDPVGAEVAHARRAAYRAALDAIGDETSNEADMLRREYQAMLERTDNAPDAAESNELPADPLRRRAIDAARQSLLTLRRQEVIGDDAFHRIEEELDWAELSAQG